MWTTGSAAVLSIIFYFIMGHVGAGKNVIVPETINILTGTLDQMFNWNILLLVPLVIVLAGSITKKPTIPVMLVASAIALINAAVFQGADLKSIRI